MGRLVRILMLGVVAAGLTLALTTSPSSGSGGGGRTLGQATGYGDDTVPPSQLETGQPASAAGNNTGSGGGHLTLIFGLGLVVVVLGGAGAYAWSRSHS
jgi:hypothetical protein